MPVGLRLYFAGSAQTFATCSDSASFSPDRPVSGVPEIRLTTTSLNGSSLNPRPSPFAA